MSLNEVILLLGSNLGDKNLNLETAKSYIQQEIGEIKKESEILETEPWGFDSENYFLNQSLNVYTSFSPMTLLQMIKNIEKKMGRTYQIQGSNRIFEDRIIDIDILTFNDLTYQSTQLTIPHYAINERDFVKKILRF